jgi:hypothetical protein
MSPFFFIFFTPVEPALDVLCEQAEHIMAVPANGTDGGHCHHAG